MRGLCPRAPVRMASSAPLFHPLTSYADAAGSFLHQRGGTRIPKVDRRPDFSHSSLTDWWANPGYGGIRRTRDRP